MSDSLVAWCGPRSDGLGWLSDRCAAVAPLKITESLSIEALDEQCHQHPRRLILSVENRLWYPLEEVQYLQRAWPEVPIAVALGPWFDGSRRTGIGSTPQLALPWYRWWDGWYPWLSGSRSGLLDAWPQMRLQVVENFAQTSTSGHILCNCRQTAAGWMSLLRPQCERVSAFTLDDYQEIVASGSSALAPHPHWLLWDDSCLNTAGAERNVAVSSSLLSAVRGRFPEAVIIAATCMPRWNDWRQWQDWGADELLSKPSSGFSLQQLLSSKSLPV